MTEVAVRRFPLLTVQTPRLVVRSVTPEDVSGVAVVLDDRQTRRWSPFTSPYMLPEARQWCGEMAVQRRDSGEGDHYVAVRREDDRLVGCLWCRHTDWAAKVTQVAYGVAPEARGYGVAAEAVDALAFALILEHGFQRVELRIAPGNVAARRVAEKAGFTYEGLLRNAGYVHSGRVDLEMWSIVAADLRGDPQSS